MKKAPDVSGQVAKFYETRPSIWGEIDFRAEQLEFILRKMNELELPRRKTSKRSNLDRFMEKCEVVGKDLEVFYARQKPYYDPQPNERELDSLLLRVEECLDCLYTITVLEKLELPEDLFPRYISSTM